MIKRDVFYIAAIGIMAAFLFFEKCGKDPVTGDDIAKAQDIEKTPPKVYVDPDGKTHVQKQTVMASAELQQALYKQTLDNIARQMNINVKQIEGFAQIAGRANGTVVTKIDTIYFGVDKKVTAQKFSFKDRFLSLDGTLTDSARIAYEVRDSLTQVFFTKNAGFLGLRKDIYADAWSDNPKMKWDNIRTVRTPYSKSSIIRPVVFVGLGYDLGDMNLKRPVPVAGVGISIGLR